MVRVAFERFDGDGKTEETVEAVREKPKRARLGVS
jgi:hypothetical protein